MTGFQVKSFFRYWLHAVDHHSLHSPFLFDFFTNVILPTPDPVLFNPIEQQRADYLRSDQTIHLKGFGAGSKHHADTNRAVKDIARTSLSPQKYAVLYWKIIQYFGARNILELGTSLGINTAYLAHNPGTRVTTFEGEPEIAALAHATFNNLKLSNTKIVDGDITKMLPRYLDECSTVDVGFLDANHRYAPTLAYFEAILKKIHPKSILILDDIHQSEEMENAWNKIKMNALVYCSIDLYRCGIVFFDPSLNKQHVVLQF